MIVAIRLAVVLVAVFSLAMGLTAMFAPERIAVALGLGVPEGMGLNTVRADIGAFFLGAAAACGAALLTRQPLWLYGAASLYGLAAVGRVVGLAFDGAPAGVAQAIVLELVLAAVLVGGGRILARQGAPSA